MNNTRSPVLSASGRPGVRQANSNSNIIPRDGGPLSHFLVGEYTSTDDEVMSNLQSRFLPKPEPKPVVASTPTKPESFPDRSLLIKESDVNVKYLDSQKEEFEQTEPSDPEDPSLGVDWDSEENWERRFLRIVFDDKKQRQLAEQRRLRQIQLIRQERQRLAADKQQIVQIKQSIEQRSNELKAREAKIAEIEPLIPSCKKLQSVGITFEVIFPYIETINEKSALENIDLKTAAYNMMRDLREYRSLGSLRRTIEHAERKLSTLGSVVRENQQAITTLTNLQRAGFSQKDIKELVALVSIWSQGNGNGISNRKLDTELIDVGNNDNLLQQPGNLQQSIHRQQNNGSSNPDPVNNGNNSHGGFSMQDFIRLQLLQTSTSNILNKIGLGKNDQGLG